MYIAKVYLAKATDSDRLFTCLGAMIFRITTLSTMTFSIMTFSIMTFRIMTFSIVTFSITTLSIIMKKRATQHNDTKHNWQCCYAECRLCLVLPMLSVT